MRTSQGTAIVAAMAVVLVFGAALVAQADAACTENIPGLDITPSKLVVKPGEIGAFTVFVNNKDTDNCPKKQFTLTGTSDAGFSVTFKDSTLDIVPKQSDSTLMKVSVPSGATAGTFDINVAATSGSIKNSRKVTVEVREELEECEVRLSRLKFKEKNADEFDNKFSQDDDVSVFADVDFLGNAPSYVTLELYVDGIILDSEKEFFPANSDTSFRFGNKIFTKNYNNRINVKVVATPDCNPNKADDIDGKIQIEAADEEVKMEAQVGKPANTVVGKEILSRVFVKNVGDDDATVNVDAFLCKTDGNGGCDIEMNCGESIILIETDETEEIDCRAITNKPGKYRVESQITFEGDEDFEKSTEFFVYSTQKELDGSFFNVDIGISTGTPATSQSPQVPDIDDSVYRISYVCSDDLRQAVYTTADGVKTSDVEFCPFGCSLGKCNPAPAQNPATGAPATEKADEADISQPKFSPPVFNLDNFLDWFKNLLFSR